MRSRSAPRSPAGCRPVVSKWQPRQKVRNKHPTPRMTTEERGRLQIVLGHHFTHADRLERALTHRSHRQNSESVDNERLEFLGDRVLGLVASEYLFQFFPEWDAGKLSK